MTRTNGQTALDWRSQGALLFLLTLVGLAAPATAQQPAEINVIRSITTVDSQIEIELTSSRPWPVRDEVVTLRVGTREFTKSRSPEDGSLNTLIFTMTSSEFAQTASGDRVTVFLGSDQSDSRDFGTLDKLLLDTKAE